MEDTRDRVCNATDVDWELEWIDERVAGGDKLREEWREKCRQNAAGDVPPEAF